MHRKKIGFQGRDIKCKPPGLGKYEKPFLSQSHPLENNGAASAPFADSDWLAKRGRPKTGSILRGGDSGVLHSGTMQTHCIPRPSSMP